MTASVFITQPYEVKSGETAQDLLLFAQKLEKGEPHLMKFKHPFTGEDLEREIIGIVDGKCEYTEGMPNGGKLECHYSPESRKAVAQYYRDLSNSDSSGTKVSLSGEVQKTTYTIDGKEVENPLQECLKNGECLISGY